MDRHDMLNRTRQFALRIIRLSAALPTNRVGDVLARQVLRSGTSVGANYREAVRASTRKQFASTMEIAQREADETLYWLDLIGDSGLVSRHRIAGLTEECDELIAILTTTIRTAKKRTATTDQKSKIRNQKS